MPRIELNVNGRTHRIDVDPERSLLGVLRDELGLRGSKYGCGEAQCGSCTVLLEDRAVRSCVTRVGAAAGRPITTVEGLERNGSLHPLQQAFLENDAFQCGYCTPGMLMAGVALLARHPRPSEPEVVRALEGNICRCGVYANIVSAVRQAAEELAADG